MPELDMIGEEFAFFLFFFLSFFFFFLLIQF